MTYEETLTYLYNRLPVFHHIGAAAYKPGLDNTIRLLQVLGNPQKNYATIHVAGTNGKGSVSHMLAAALQSAGYKTGLYTSPHLVDFGERIRIDGEMIDRDYTVNFVESHMDLLDKIQPSFFEATMAMAFRYFADKKVDIAVIEVGLGGRLDSTNIIEPELSVITNISFDHMGFLGDTLAKIAGEKAGIIKYETPVVIGEWLDETKPVFDRKAAEMNAPIYYTNRKLKSLGYDQHKLICADDEGKEYKSGLVGDYQLKNIATLLQAVDVFNLKNTKGFRIHDDALKNGIENITELTGLRGRWETVHEHPLVVTDTGHNVAGISYVVQQLQKQACQTLRIVIGMVNDKDITHVLELLPAEAEYYFTQAHVERALSADNLLQLAKEKGLHGRAFHSVEAAYKTARTDASENDFIFVGGSNFVVGEFLALSKF